MSEESKTDRSALFGGAVPAGIQTKDVMRDDFGFEIPVESIPLPSNGAVYPADSPLHCRETVDIRAMTAREEDILTSRALIKKGTVITELIKSCLMLAVQAEGCDVVTVEGLDASDLKAAFVRHNALQCGFCTPGIAMAAAALLAAQNGAKIIRVHDVAETKDVLSVLAAVQGADVLRMARASFDPSRVAEGVVRGVSA